MTVPSDPRPGIGNVEFVICAWRHVHDTSFIETACVTSDCSLLNRAK